MSGSDISEELNVTPLLARTKRSQLRWFVYLARKPPGCLPGEIFPVIPLGESLGSARDTLDKFHLLAGLATAWDPPGEIRGNRVRSARKQPKTTTL